MPIWAKGGTVQTQYVPVPIDFIAPMDGVHINDSGHVLTLLNTSTSSDGSLDFSKIVDGIWDRGVTTTLGQGFFGAINNHDAVITTVIRITSSTTAQFLPATWSTTGGYHLEPTPPNGSGIFFGINDSGTYVGGAAFEFPPVTFKAVSGTPGVAFHTLGTLPGDKASLAMGINNAGDIVGLSAPAATAGQGLLDSVNNPRAILIHNGVVKNLGTLHGDPSSVATAINDAGIIVGISTPLTTGGLDVLSTGPGSGFIYSNGKLTDLGSLGGNLVSPKHINNANQVVGSATDASGNSIGFIYQNGVIQNVNTLLTANSPYTITSANDINKDGVILSVGTDSNGDDHGILLYPKSIYGNSEKYPLLADSHEPNDPATHVDDWTFNSVADNQWVVVPTAFAIVYLVDPNASLITSMTLPTLGLGNAGLDVQTDTVDLGAFHPGDTIDFLRLLGHGVQAFGVVGIDPLANNLDGKTFAVELHFDTPGASVDVRRADIVPLPAALGPGLAMLALGGLVSLRKRRIRGQAPIKA